MTAHTFVKFHLLLLLSLWESYIVFMYIFRDIIAFSSYIFLGFLFLFDFVSNFFWGNFFVYSHFFNFYFFRQWQRSFFFIFFRFFWMIFFSALYLFVFFPFAVVLLDTTKEATLEWTRYPYGPQAQTPGVSFLCF